MLDETHVRLTLTRGKKITSGMNPQLNQFGCTLIILAEWKPAIYSGKKLKLVTSNIRRNSPLCLDSKIHHNNLTLYNGRYLAKFSINFTAPWLMFTLPPGNLELMLSPKDSVLTLLRSCPASMANAR